MKQKYKKIVIYTMILSMLSLFGAIPPLPVAHAVDSLTSARDLISDTDVSVASSTHIFTFTTGTTTPITGYIEAVFPAPFGDVLAANVICPANFTASAPDTETARCTATAPVAPGALEIQVSGVSNPTSAGDQTITISLYNELGAVLKERVEVLVFIIDDVLMTARVSSTLDFTISGLANTENVNGVGCDQNTTATTTDFGTLSLTASTTVCQELTVATNASNGYTVTVFQDGELTNSTADTINSFNNSPDGTGSTTAQAWTFPTNTLDQKHTYGHMGLTSDDTDLNSLGGYENLYHAANDPWYVGLNSTDPMPIMHHNGPSDGSTQDKGLARVAYTIEIASLQEAGDYESTLTYIATPIY